jgi:sugar phosphate isomerase/epimerase
MRLIHFSLVLAAWIAAPLIGAEGNGSNAKSESASSAPLFSMNNLLAWCIVPYDSLNRTPAQRVEMLQRLGLTQYVWDWRPQHLEDLPEEIAVAKQQGVRIRAVWLWIDENTDQVGRLSAANRAVISAVAEAKIPMEFWVGVHPNVFAGLNETGRIAKGSALLKYLRDEAAKVGGTIALYNHGDWFGEPENQLKLIEAVGNQSVGMVYNFHHGHEHIARFETLLPKLVPHLRAVNLNGMTPEGPKILTIGAGTHEREMIQALKNSGYAGPLGVLGHTEGEDVEIVLRRNLDGLSKIVTSLK